MSRNTVEIPLKTSLDEVIELDLRNLPDGNEVIQILQSEKPLLNVWIPLALAYYKQKKEGIFLQILECSRNDATLGYKDFEKDQMKALDTLAAYYVSLGNKEREPSKKKELYAKATMLYGSADKILMYDPHHLVGRAHLCLAEALASSRDEIASGKTEQADAQFSFVLNQFPHNIPSLLGKACINFNKRDYKTALTFYRRCLRINPNCGANIRLGIGHCLYRMNQVERAKLAFERALKKDPQCVGAIVALAIMELNKKTPANIKAGVEMLSQAYKIDPQHGMVLNHLANHFFFKKDYQTVYKLALNVSSHAPTDHIKAEGCYQLARRYHVMGEYDQAFQFYYQATQFATPTFVLPFYGLGQMHIQRGDLNNAAPAFERVLKYHPNNYETMKILGSIYAQSDDLTKREQGKNFFKKVIQLHPEDFEVYIELAQILQQNDIAGMFLNFFVFFSFSDCFVLYFFNRSTGLLYESYKYIQRID